MKTYYATQDIEDMAARGVTELHLDHDTVLTDLARDAAQRLGVRLVQPGMSRPATGTPTAQPATAVAAPPPAAVKPKGCQHGPLTPPASAVTSDAGAAGGASNSTGNTVVDQMVGLVRQLAGKK